MEYRGQLIHRFDVLRDEALFSSNSKQIILFTRIVIPTLAGITVLFAMFQGSQTTSDLLGYTIIIALLGLVYTRIINRLKKFQEFDLDDLEEALIVMEYGIEFPPFTREDMELSTEEYFNLKPVFLTYNQIKSIQIQDDQVIFHGDEKNFIVDLDYYPFYSESSDASFNEQIDFFLELMKKISDNLDKIENRDHPTIIPRAYFKNILQSLSNSHSKTKTS